MIKVSVNSKELIQRLVNMPRDVRHVAMKAAAEYFVGNSSYGLKHEPAEKFVNRATAYGKVSDAPAGYFSWKQFRYVAAITEGFTKQYTRTHQLSSAWEVKGGESDWTKTRIVNDAPGAKWVMGKEQARQPALVGWRKVSQVFKDNMRGAIRAAQLAVNKLLKGKGK